MDTDAGTSPALAVEEERSFLTRVMGWMFTGLAITGVIAWALGTSGAPGPWFDDPTWIFLVPIVAQFVAVAGLSLRIQRLSPPVAAAIFLGYSALNGLTFSILLSGS